MVRRSRATLVRVLTEDGVEGWSAGQAMSREREGLGSVLGPYLLGQDAVDIDAIQQRLRELSYTRRGCSRAASRRPRGLIRRIRQAGLRYTPHTWTNGVGFVVNLHLMAASGFAEEELLEYPIDLPGFTPEARDAVLTEPFLHDRGRIDVPDRPGLGIEIAPEVLAAHATRFFVVER